MLPYAAAYAASLAAFLIVDLLWLGYVARDWYQSALAHLLADRVDLRAAAAFYVIYPMGLVLLAIAPALRTGSWSEALVGGLLVGFFCYATYDLTNLATLRAWPVTLALADMAWGAALSGLSAVTGFAAARALS
jgi:uncharacterized membrane protein